MSEEALRSSYSSAIFIEIEPGEPNELVRCKRVQGSIDDIGRYIALSYDEGDPNRQHPIYVENAKHYVRFNLFTAL